MISAIGRSAWSGTADARPKRSSIPTQVCTQESDYAPATGDAGVYDVVDTDIQERIERFTKELLLFAEHLRGLRTAAG